MNMVDPYSKAKSYTFAKHVGQSK